MTGRFPRAARLCLALILLASPAVALARFQEPDAPPDPAQAQQVPASDPQVGSETAANLVPPPPRAAAPVTVGRGAVLDLVKKANPFLWPLVACSIVTVGFALERAFALRKGRVIPRDFTERFIERLASGKLDRDRALELCRSNDSPMARVFAHVLRYWGQPAATIRQAVDHDAAAEVVDLKRNVRVLNGTSTLAPLLGLFGTVVGMIESFEALSSRSLSAGRSEALAHGISLALVATAIGLAIAAVSVVLYYMFLHRVDTLVREMDDRTRQVIDLVASETGRPAADRRTTNPTEAARLEARASSRMDPF